MRIISLEFHETGSLLLAFIILVCSVALSQIPSPSVMSGSLEIVTPQNTNQAIGSPLEILVIARNLPAEVVRALFVVIDDSTSKTLVNPFVMTGQSKIPQDQPTSLRFVPDEKSFKDTNSAKGTLILFYRAGDASKVGQTQAWSFNLVQPAPKITVDVRPLMISRSVPFRSTFLNNEAACFDFQSVPPTLKPPETVQGTLFEAAGDGARPARTKVTAKTIGKQICLTTEIAGSYTQMKGKLWLRPPEVKETADVALDLRIKDLWVWRALAAILAVFPAMLLIYWTTTVRRRLLNGLERDTTSARLHEFLSTHPDLANDAAVTFIRQLILNSTTEDKINDFEASEQSLASAKDRLEQLFTSPPAAPVALVASQEVVRIVNPPQRIIAGKKIVFVIGQPMPEWPVAGGMYRWTIASSPGVTEATIQGVELKTIEHVFKLPGSYRVSVSVNDIDAPPRSLAVLNRPKPSFIQQFRIVELAVLTLTTVLAVGTAFLTTETAPTFGTFGDYFKLFAAAFGVSGGTGSVATIFSSLRGR